MFDMKGASSSPWSAVHATNVSGEVLLCSPVTGSRLLPARQPAAIQDEHGHLLIQLILPRA
jgi:hypothetical protein